MFDNLTLFKLLIMLGFEKFEGKREEKVEQTKFEKRVTSPILLFIDKNTLQSASTWGRYHSLSKQHVVKSKGEGPLSGRKQII